MKNKTNTVDVAGGVGWRGAKYTKLKAPNAYTKQK